MTLYDYLSGMDHKTQLEHLEEIEISTVTNDSRQVRRDCIFVCIQGDKFDGHDKAAQALEDREI